MKFITPSRFSELLDRLEEADSDAPDSQELAWAYRTLYDAHRALGQKDMSRCFTEADVVEILNDLENKGQLGIQEITNKLNSKVADWLT